MSEPENFLSRWSRRKREADAAPKAETQADPATSAASADAPAPAERAAAEPTFDLSSLPSLDSIGAGTDVSLFMQAGVPSALRHAALRRAWATDPAIRDFRGLQENDWDFNVPDNVPGFGTFKTETEIKELARRLFGDEIGEKEPVPQSAPHDSGNERIADVSAASDRTLDKYQETSPHAEDAQSDDERATATHHDDHAAVQRVTARRHGGALPQ